MVADPAAVFLRMDVGQAAVFHHMKAPGQGSRLATDQEAAGVGGSTVADRSHQAPAIGTRRRAAAVVVVAAAADNPAAAQWDMAAQRRPQELPLHLQRVARPEAWADVVASKIVIRKVSRCKARVR